jgi:hypothetical protein
MHWSRAVLGYVGEKLRTYVFRPGALEPDGAVLERREAKRQRLQERGSEGGVSGSPVSLAVLKWGGDPAATATAGRTPASPPASESDGVRVAASTADPDPVRPSWPECLDL